MHVVVLTINSLVPIVTVAPAPIEQLSTQTLVFLFFSLTNKHPWLSAVDLQSVATWHSVPNDPPSLDSEY
jgi:hypothetical protein